MKQKAVRIIEVSDEKFVVALVDDNENVWAYEVFPDKRTALIAAKLVWNVLKEFLATVGKDNRLTYRELIEKLKNTP